MYIYTHTHRQVERDGECCKWGHDDNSNVGDGPDL